MPEKRREWTANSMIGEFVSDRLPQLGALNAHAFSPSDITRQLEQEAVW